MAYSHRIPVKLPVTVSGISMFNTGGTGHAGLVMLRMTLLGSLMIRLTEGSMPNDIVFALPAVENSYPKCANPG